MKNSNILLIVLIAVVLVGAIVFFVISSDNAEQVVVKTASTSLGTIMVGNNGMSLYMFVADTAGESTCYGQCAVFWPPLLVSENVVPKGTGTTANFGVTQRTDGTFQVTANNMPLYFYANDNNPGDVNGQGSTGAGALWWVLSSSGQIITTLPGETPQPGQPQQPGDAHEVEIEDFAYNPATLTINVGERVEWRNRDSVGHSVTSDSGSELSSGMLSLDQTYSHTFNTAGTYSYHCIPHPNMKGTVIVV